MSNNSILGYAIQDLQRLQEAIGITQFPSDTNMYHTIGGLLFQAGRISADNATIVKFNAGFPKQCLGVWLQLIQTVPTSVNVSVADITSEEFKINISPTGAQDFYWFAIGV
jgi:hypothetical protein